MYASALQGQTKYLVPKERALEFMDNNSKMQVLEMLAKLTQAYPAYSTLMMP